MGGLEGGGKESVTPMVPTAARARARAHARRCRVSGTSGACTLLALSRLLRVKSRADRVWPTAQEAEV